MNGRQAERLARVAGPRRLGGVRGWPGRRAWQRLVRAGDLGDGNAIEAVWGSWLREPGDEAWESLARWWPESLRDKVFTAAVDPARAPGRRHAIGEFCARHGLAPAGAVDRAVFFVLTGQAALHRAHDPDGSLLAAGYRGMADLRRTMLRQAMLDAGDLDLVRAVVVDRPDRVRTGEEIDYLARRYAGAREWARLWRLVRDAPVVPAVAAMPLFADWRPTDDAGRALFARLAAARPAAVAAAVEAVKAGRSTRIDGYHPGDVSFAPDNSQLAISDRGVYLTVCALPGGERVARGRMRWLGSVLHLGDRILAIQESSLIAEPGRLLLHRGSRCRGLRTQGHPWDARKVVKVGTTYVVATRDGLLLDDGRRIRLDELGLHEKWWWSFHLAGLPAEAKCGRIALCTSNWLPHDLVILDEDRRIVARYRGDEHSRFHDMMFAGPGGLVTLDEAGAVRRWRRVGDTLEVMATAQAAGMLPGPDSWPVWQAHPQLRLCGLPELGLVAAVGPRGVVCLDADTLAPADPPRELAGDRVGRLWSSDDGSHLAVARTKGYLDVHDLRLRDVADEVDRPMANMGTTALAAVTATERHDFPQDVRELFDLLRACLAHRFATEIQLGTATGQHAKADDIALGGRE